MNILLKTLFFLKKPKIIVIVGKEREKIKEMISCLLQKQPKPDKDFFIFETEMKKINDFSFFFKNSELPVLVVNSVDEPVVFLKEVPKNVYLVLNYDEEKLKEFGGFSDFKKIKFGLKEKCDVSASDIKKINEEGVNFKVNYKGSIVPFWLRSDIDINMVLSIISVGILFDLNLVEISQTLKNEACFLQ